MSIGDAVVSGLHQAAFRNPVPKMEGARSFLSLDKESSVYAQVALVLSRREDWRRDFGLPKSFDLMLAQRHGQRDSFSRLGRSLAPGQVQLVNYMPGSLAITRKANLVRTLRGERSPSTAASAGLPGYLPLSFILGAEGPAQAPGALDERSEREFAALAEAHAGAAGPCLWIVKPSSGAKGDGIVIFRDPADVRAHVEGGPRTEYVAQRYVDTPLLVHGVKFDLRVWVLVSRGRVLLYKQGVLRLASEPYHVEDFDDPDKLRHAHLTNHCLQHSSDKFGRLAGQRLGMFAGDCRVNWLRAWRCPCCPQAPSWRATKCSTSNLGSTFEPSATALTWTNPSSPRHVAAVRPSHPCCPRTPPTGRRCPADTTADWVPDRSARAWRMSSPEATMPSASFPRGRAGGLVRMTAADIFPRALSASNSSALTFSSTKRLESGCSR